MKRLIFALVLAGFAAAAAANHRPGHVCEHVYYNGQYYTVCYYVR